LERSPMLLMRTMCSTASPIARAYAARAAVAANGAAPSRVPPARLANVRPSRSARYGWHP
jgi:hypothetical protein